jgi:hypothetical protein
MHSLFERHGEPAADEIVELPVALAGKGSQGLTPVCEYLFFGSGHVKIRADGVGNVLVRLARHPFPDHTGPK